MSSIHIYLLGIDTDAVTYSTDACWRRRSIPMLSHIPRGHIQAPHPHTHAYILCRSQKKNIQKYYVFFTSNKIQKYYNKIYHIK